MNFLKYATLIGTDIQVERKVAAALKRFICYTVSHEKLASSLFKYRPVDDYGLLKIVHGYNVDHIDIFTHPDDTFLPIRTEIHYTDGTVDVAIPDSFELSEL